MLNRSICRSIRCIVLDGVWKSLQNPTIEVFYFWQLIEWNFGNSVQDRSAPATSSSGIKAIAQLARAFRLSLAYKIQKLAKAYMKTHTYFVICVHSLVAINILPS